MTNMPSLPNTDANSGVYPLNTDYHLYEGTSELATFYALQGGDMEISVIRHKAIYPSGESFNLLIPSMVTYSPIILSRGFGNTAFLYDWFAQAANGLIYKARKNLTIELCGFSNGVYKPIVRWNLNDAWVSKISGFEMDQYSSASLARLTITLIAEKITREDPT